MHAASSDALPLSGRAALVTGASRRRGIGFAVAQRLRALGADVFVHGHPPHDAAASFGADPGGMDGIAAALREVPAGTGARVASGLADLGEPEAPAQLVEAAREALGGLDIVIATHTHWRGQSFAELTAAELDRHLAVIVRGSLLLAQALAATRAPGPGGRVVLFLTGQHHGPMTSEIAYATAKGALHQATPSLADAVAGQGITVNAVNPGPCDTGWADPGGALHEAIRQRMPGGRWGTPEDIAKVVGWLCSDDAAWVSGQVIDAEGGFRRHQWNTGESA